VTRKLPIYQVDAFTDRVFAGNPAAIVVLDSWLPDATLQAIAAENNLPATAFLHHEERIARCAGSRRRSSCRSAATARSPPRMSFSICANQAPLASSSIPRRAS
jgi:hypothetical protein